MKVWVLTSEVNDYNQCGEYFDGVFSAKPTVKMLAEKCVGAETAEYLIVTGGGRRKSEDSWYYLREVDA